MSLNLSIDEIVKATKAQLLVENTRSPGTIDGVGTDTRVNLTGKIFVALKGPNFDAHNFLQQAIDQGAEALIIHEKDRWRPLQKKVITFLVSDTLIALQELASFWRKKLSTKILAVTGSNGKTTTKEFAASILNSQVNTYCNKGSFNNHWGVPLSLLQIDTQHKAAIIEMGMNHLREIQNLCQIAQPDIVVATTVGRVHLEGLGSIENVAKAKEEIYQEGRRDVLRIFNLDNQYTLAMKNKFAKLYGDKDMLTFSNTQKEATVFLSLANSNVESLSVTGKIAGVEGRADVNVFGPHNISNLAGAAALALAAGLKPEQIWKGLALCQTPWGRNQRVKLKNGSEVLFDGYNANPESMGKMIENAKLSQVKGKKIAVIGEMLEQGEMRDELHREIGRKAGKAGFSLIWFIGQPLKAFTDGIVSAGHKGEFYTSGKFDPTTAEKIRSSLTANDRIWVKGSRGIKLEQAVLAFDPVDFSVNK